MRLQAFKLLEPNFTCRRFSLWITRVTADGNYSPGRCQCRFNDTANPGRIVLDFKVFDVAILILLVSFTLMSYLRGAMKEFFGLLGLCAGFFAANWYSPRLAEMVRPLLPDGHGAELLSFVLIMVAGYLAGSFLAGFLDTFRRTPESGLSRLVASSIGFAKGVIISLAVQWVIMAYLPEFQGHLRGSWAAGRLDSILTYFKQIDWI